MINVISKPLIVDLLRTFDKNKWLSPKIRYASVRSKGELIEDLRRHFRDRREGTLPGLVGLFADGTPWGLGLTVGLAGIGALACTRLLPKQAA